MKFCNKKTGEIRTLYDDYKDGKIHLAGESDLLGKLCYNSLKELCEDWEDAPQEKKYGGRVPESLDGYYYIDDDGSLQTQVWAETRYDIGRFECGNGFWTKEETEKELARRKAYVILKEDTKGFKPNWKNNDEEKYHVLYSHDLGRFSIGWNRQLNGGEKLYFATEEDAEASIEAHRQLWLDYLGIEEENGERRNEQE